jgi:hypothetical protein
MTKIIGRKEPFGLKLETVRNSGEVTGGYWLPYTSLESNNTVTTAVNTGAVGHIMDSTGSDVIKKHSETSLTFDFYDDMAANVATMILGSGVLASVGTGAYSGTFGVFNSNQPQTYTLWRSGEDAQWVSSGNVPNSVEITVDATGDTFAQVTVNFMGYEWVSGATIPAVSYTSTSKKFRPQDASIAITSGALTSTRSIRNATFTFNRNAFVDWALGNTSPASAYSQQLDTSFAVVATWDSTDTASEATGYYTHFENGNNLSGRLSISNTRVLSGAVSPLFQLDFAKLNVTEFTRDTGIDGIVSQLVTAKASYNLTNASGVTATVKTGVAL